MKSLKKLVCMALVCITLLGLVVPGHAYSPAAYKGDPFVVGKYKNSTDWTSWSPWTYNKLETKSVNRNEFNGELCTPEIKVKTRTVYIRQNGKVDTVYNVLIGKFGYNGGYKATVKQYRFKVRMLHWRNERVLPTATEIINIKSEEKRQLYADLAIFNTYEGIVAGRNWAVEQLEAELRGLVIGSLSNPFASTVYDLVSLAEDARSLRDYIAEVKAAAK